MFIHFVVWGGQEEHTPDRLAKDLVALAVGKCSRSHTSLLSVLNFLCPPLVFPEAWNLKVNNWVLSLKAVSREWKSTGASSKSDSGTWQTHIQWVSNSILTSC